MSSSSSGSSKSSRQGRAGTKTHGIEEGMRADLKRKGYPLAIVERKVKEWRDLCKSENEKEVWQAQQEFRPGQYQHYKGNFYHAMLVGMDSETCEPVVVYRALYGAFRLWVRPYRMWNEKVTHEGKTKKRFEYIGPM